MDIEVLLGLAVLQGITEFLPISSSGHLILVSSLTSWPDQGLNIDIALHIGTLAAVMLYFWRDSLSMAQGGVHMLRGHDTESRRLTLLIAVATIPVVVAGFLLYRYIVDAWRSAELIAFATLGFGVLLYAADRWGGRSRSIGQMTVWDATLIGLAQILALVPGTSRSGITMTAARMLGYDRENAARFSLLLSIPTTAAAGALGIMAMMSMGGMTIPWDAVLAGAMAFVAALLAIGGLMAWVRRASLTPFVVYRLILGVALLVILYV